MSLRKIRDNAQWYVGEWWAILINEVDTDYRLGSYERETAERAADLLRKTYKFTKARVVHLIDGREV